MFHFIINGNSCFCIPPSSELGRGARANTLLVDDYKDIPSDILDPIVCGFSAVCSSPIDKIKGRKIPLSQIIYTERLYG